MEREENPDWSRLLGWPLVVVLALLLLGAPIAVKLATSRPAPPAPPAEGK